MEANGLGVLGRDGGLGVGDLIKHAALAARLHGGGAALAAGTILGGRVGAADGGGLAEEADVAILAEVGGPRVADEPIVLLEAVVGAVADELDNVVDVDILVIGAAVEDAALVEGPLRGVNIDGEGAGGDKGLHRGVAAVALDVHNVREVSDGAGIAGGAADAGVAIVASVGVLELLGDAAIVNDVLEGKVSGGALAAAGAAAVIGVGGAGGELLGGHVEELASANGEGGLEGRGRGEGPAGAAAPLILDGRDDLRDGAAPVDAVGEGRGAVEALLLLLAGEVHGGEAHLGGGHASEETDALVLRPVSHVVNVHGPALVRVGVVGVDHLQVGVEGGLAGGALLGGGIGLLEVLGEGLEGIGVECLEGGGLSGGGSADDEGSGDSGLNGHSFA